MSVTFEYKTNTSGETGTKAQNSSTVIPTGSAEYTKANNIYDLAGNFFELTIESYGFDGRICRGGGYFNNGSEGPAIYRDTGTRPTDNTYQFGFRAYLYVK